MVLFFRDLMKALTRQVSTGQYHQASHTLVRVGVALSEIRLQRRFKNIVLLGGVEQTLKAMNKVISLLGKKKTYYMERNDRCCKGDSCTMYQSEVDNTRVHAVLLNCYLFVYLELVIPN